MLLNKNPSHGAVVLIEEGEEDGVSVLAGKIITHMRTWQNTCKAITCDNFSSRLYTYEVCSFTEIS